jgi:hypothetical protein
LQKGDQSIVEDMRTDQWQIDRLAKFVCNKTANTEKMSSKIRKQAEKVLLVVLID